MSDNTTTGADDARVLLLPCPFCGGEATSTRDDGTRIECASYWCLGPVSTYVTADKAIAAWNTRAALARLPTTDVEAENAKLQGLLRRIVSGEAFRGQRFAEDDDADYFLRCQRAVMQEARAALGDA